MTSQVYRFYNSNGTNEWNYEFSIVASEEEARFVIPFGRPDYDAVYNQDRITNHIKNLIRDGEPLPTSPEDWALLSAYNINYNLLAIENQTSMFFDLLVNDEQKYADKTFKKYEDILFPPGSRAY